MYNNYIYKYSVNRVKFKVKIKFSAFNSKMN